MKRDPKGDRTNAETALLIAQSICAAVVFGVLAYQIFTGDKGQTSTNWIAIGALGVGVLIMLARRTLASRRGYLDDAE